MTTLSAYFLKMGDVLPADAAPVCTLLNEGFSNRVYRLSWQGVDRLVLRIADIDADIFFINRTEEMRLLTCASSNGLSPKIVWSDRACDFACEFVSQPSLSWDVEHQENNLLRLAKALGDVHLLPKGVHEYQVLSVIEHYLSQIAPYVVGESYLQQEYSFLLNHLQSLRQPKALLPYVLCHNDLNPKNILMDDHKLWVIDWEYAGVGDPLFDLAVIAKSHNLSDVQVSVLVSAYRPDLNLVEAMDSIAVYMKCYGLREMAWLLLKHLVTPEDAFNLQQYYHFKASPTLNPFYKAY